MNKHEDTWKWYDYLPYDLRRTYYRHALPKKYWSLIALRNDKNTNEYSLKGFEQNKCIFVHIPKCAGVSINKALFDNLGGGHHSAMDYQIIYGRSIYESYYKFTFVRNPWDRVFSAYNFLKEGGFDEKDKTWAEKNLLEYDTFDKFICEWVNARNINTKNHFVPQYKYICNAAGKVIVDYIGKFEKIQEDYEHIVDKIGVTATLHHKNRTMSMNKELNYTEFYTEKTRRIIRDVYKKDIELLGYGYDRNF